MSYADYAYYTGTFAGNKISEADFPSLARDASAFIDRLTLGKLKSMSTIPDPAKMATCAVAERVQVTQKTGAESVNPAIKSESVDGDSTSYNDTVTIRSQLYADYENAALPYLYGTGLLYAGGSVMLTNADITVYNKHYNKTTRLDEWFHTQISTVHWHGKQAVSVGDKGLSAASVYIVRVPASSAPSGKKYVMPSDYTATDSAALAGLWTLQNGDIVARGLIDTPDPKNITVEHFTVTGWADNRYGSENVQHWRIDGK